MRRSPRLACVPRCKLACVLACVLVLLAACSDELTVEQQVIVTIREMEARIEAGERRPFLAYISEDFRGQDSSLNHDQLRALLILQMNRYPRLQAQLFPIRVVETGEGVATADFRALVTGGPDWIPESGQLFEFKTHWRREDDEWRLIAADWEPVL
jgi:hypothetical protein